MFALEAMLEDVVIAKTMTLAEAFEAFLKEWIVMDLEPGSSNDLNRQGVVLYHGPDRQRAEDLISSRCSTAGHELQMLYGRHLPSEDATLKEIVDALGRGELELDPRVLELWN